MMKSNSFLFLVAICFYFLCLAFAHEPPIGLQNNNQPPPTGLQNNNQPPPTDLQNNNQPALVGLQTKNCSQSTSLPNNNQAPPTGLPENNQPPVTGLPDNNQAPTAGLPNKNQAPPAGLPNNNQAPPARSQNNNQALPTGSQNNNQAPPTGSQNNNQAPPTGSENNNQAPPKGSENNNQAPPKGSENSIQEPPISFEGKYKGYFSKVYAFGDSYTDTGNGFLMGGLANSVTNATKYGEGFHRLCNGRLVVDFLCDALSIPPLPPYEGGASADFSHGVNFAVAGSTSLSSDLFLKDKIRTLIWKKKTPVSFQTQIDWYKKFLLEKGCVGMDDSGCKAQMNNTLFWVGAMGVNDYTRLVGTSFSLRWLADRSVFQVGGLLKTLLNSGAKYIVVEGLPPVGCLPVCMSNQAILDQMGCVASVNAAVMIHNQILQRKLKFLQRTNPGCSIIYADNWKAYLTILTNPAKYMFKEPFKACCGEEGGEYNCNRKALCGSPGTSTCSDAVKYMVWDGIHLTEAMNRQLTDLFLDQGFSEPSFSELIKCKSGK